MKTLIVQTGRDSAALLLVGGRTAGVLVEADHVSCRIAESRGYLGRISTNRLHEFTTVGNDRVDGRRHTVHHDVYEQSWFGRCRSTNNPLATHFSGRVVESV